MIREALIAGTVLGLAFSALLIGTLYIVLH